MSVQINDGIHVKSFQHSPGSAVLEVYREENNHIDVLSGMKFFFWNPKAYPEVSSYREIDGDFFYNTPTIYYFNNSDPEDAHIDFLTVASFEDAINAVKLIYEDIFHI